MIRKEFIPFLKKLKKNNSKEWFDANRDQYQALREELIVMVDDITRKLGKTDVSIANLDPRKSIFRINRDIRFSANKAPYKNNMGCYMNAGGKKSPSAGYYLHIEPNNCFLAGGMWQPESEVLGKLRQEIDYNGKELQKIISSKNFKAAFGGLSDEDKLQRIPKGFDQSHPYAELLKLKSFVVVHSFDEKLIYDPKFTDYTVKIFKEMYPLNQFLNVIFE